MALQVAICVILIVNFVSATIDCFKCVSIDGNNPACDDPFNNNYTVDIYQSPCMGGRKHRDGLFPATACIKMSGYFKSNGTRLMVRHCALDSGSTTTDSEIVRMSHCGSFMFENEMMIGCLQSCNDADACNAGRTLHDSILNLCSLSTFAILSSKVLLGGISLSTFS